MLGGRHLAQYHECRACLSLQVVNPTWLDLAYAGESQPLANNPDQGRFARNFSAYSTFVALHEAGVTSERPVVLDFGGGYGLLAQMLKSGGYEAWQVDPYVPVPFLRRIAACPPSTTSPRPASTSSSRSKSWST